MKAFMPEVKDFSNEVIKKATQRSGGKAVPSPIPQLVSIFAFFIGALYTINWLTNPLYHIFGFVLVAGTVVSHYYLYERRIGGLAHDTRCVEYGLLPLLQQEHPFLLGDRRGPGRLLANAKPAAKTIFSGVLPPYGISILALLPFDYLESRRAIRVIKGSQEIGGRIEQLIAKGYSDEEIRKQLSTL